MNKDKIECEHCGYSFEKDTEDYKNIIDTGECLGCFETK